MAFPYYQGQGLDLNTQAKGSVLPSFGVDAGTANAYAITTNAPIGSGGVLQNGSRFYFIATNANTGASTLAINGGSAIAIKKNVSAALVAGDIPAGAVIEVVYDGTNFQIFGTTPASFPNFADAETPSGSGTSYSLIHAPNPTASLILCVDGQVMKAGGTDYAISGTSITFATAPRTGANIQAWYRY